LLGNTDLDETIRKFSFEEAYLRAVSQVGTSRDDITIAFTRL